MMTNTRLLVYLRSWGCVALGCLLLSSQAAADFGPFGADSLNFMKSNSALVVSTGTAKTIESTDDHVVIEATVDKTYIGEARPTVRVVVLKTTGESLITPERFTKALVFLKAPLNEKSLEHYKVDNRQQPVSLLTSRAAVIQPAQLEQWTALNNYLSLESAEERLTWAEEAASSLDVNIQKWGLKEVSAHLGTAPETARQLLIDLTDNKLPRLSPANQKILVQQLVALKDFGIRADRSIAEDTAHSKLVWILTEDKIPFTVRTSAYYGITESKRPDFLFEWANANPARGKIALALSEYEKASEPERVKLTRQWRQWGDSSLQSWGQMLLNETKAGTTTTIPDVPIAELQQLLTSKSRKDHLVLADKVSTFANQESILPFVKEVVSGETPDYLRERLIDSIASRYSEPTIDFLEATAINEKMPLTIRTSALRGIGRHAKQHDYANNKLKELISKLPEAPLGILTKSMVVIKD